MLAGVEQDTGNQLQCTRANRTAVKCLRHGWFAAWPEDMRAVARSRAKDRGQACLCNVPRCQKQKPTQPMTRATRSRIETEWHDHVALLTFWWPTDSAPCHRTWRIAMTGPPGLAEAHQTLPGTRPSGFGQSPRGLHRRSLCGLRRKASASVRAADHRPLPLGTTWDRPGCKQSRNPAQ